MPPRLPVGGGDDEEHLVPSRQVRQDPGGQVGGAEEPCPHVRRFSFLIFFSSGRSSLPVIVLDAVNEENAVQVVDLVLHHPSEEAPRLVLHLVPSRSTPVTSISRARHLLPYAGHGEASLVVGSLFLGGLPDEPG